MSEGLNRVMLLGNLGTDPEYRVTPSGTGVLKLRLATSESYLDRNRVRQEKTEWHSVVIWGKRGEALHRILSKGDRVFIEGALRHSSYEAQDGSKRYTTDVVASNVVLLRTRGATPSERDAEYNSGDFAGYGGGSDPNDDIPF